MKRISSLSFAFLIFSAVSFQTILLMGCKGSPKPYTSQADGFSIAFPPGTSSGIPQNKDFNNGIIEWRHRAGTSDAAYEVVVTTFPDRIVRTEGANAILAKGAEFEQGTVIDWQETTFHGYPAVVSRREFNNGARTAYIRSVIFFVEPKYKLYAIRAAGRDKAALDSAAVNDYINSFKLE